MKSPTVLLSMLLAIASASHASAQTPDSDGDGMPLAPNYAPVYYPKELTGLAYRQYRARFESEQRMLRSEWNNWTGYDPSRPTLNASYISYTAPRYFVPARGVIVSSGYGRHWYW